MLLHLSFYFIVYFSLFSLYCVAPELLLVGLSQDMSISIFKHRFIYGIFLNLMRGRHKIEFHRGVKL